MKFFKVFAASVLLLVICAFIGMNDFVFSEEMKKDPVFEGNREVWGTLIADSVNAQKIKLHINNRDIDNVRLYMNDEGMIMFPATLVVDEMNCGMRTLSDGNHLIIQRNNTVVTWHLDDNKITVSRDNRDMEMDTRLYIEKDGDDWYLPLEFLVEGLECQYMWIPETNTLNVFDLFSSKAYPSALYYKDMDKLPVVKNQGSLGTCWAFAALSALESSLLPGEAYEFSVDHMTINNGFFGTQNDGGEYTMALAYLAAWQGPVYAADDPYGDGVSPDNLEAVKHVQEARIIAAKDFETIKEMVFKYGAVQTSLYTSLKDAKDDSEFYNPITSAYCYIGKDKPNHDVVIVGWDDNYSKDNFNTEIEADGAFICMNSWGEAFGNDGIFYVSYFDTNIGIHNIVYTGVEDADNYDKIYQSDLCGWVGQLGYMKDTAYFANVYTAGEDETLEAVSFYAIGKDTSYEVFYVPNFKDQTSFSNMRPVTKGKLENAGYYTVEFDESIRLSADEKFAVVVKIKTPGAERPIAVEYAVDKSTQSVDISDGEGYISLQGTVWENTEKMQNCNVCLKAFTNKAKAGNIK